MFLLMQPGNYALESSRLH